MSDDSTIRVRRGPHCANGKQGNGTRARIGDAGGPPVVASVRDRFPLVPGNYRLRHTLRPRPAAVDRVRNARHALADGG